LTPTADNSFAVALATSYARSGEPVAATPMALGK
jgi:hypothetical protein